MFSGTCCRFSRIRVHVDERPRIEIQEFQQRVTVALQHYGQVLLVDTRRGIVLRVLNNFYW